MGRLAPTKNPAVTRVREVHPCDRCGFSSVDGSHISAAKYEVQLPGDGRLYLCGSHMRRHWAYATERQYAIVALDSVDAN